jgi:hypothetical protein
MALAEGQHENNLGEEEDEEEEEGGGGALYQQNLAIPNIATDDSILCTDGGVSTFEVHEGT